MRIENFTGRDIVGELREKVNDFSSEVPLDLHLADFITKEEKDTLEDLLGTISERLSRAIAEFEQKQLRK